MTFILFGRRNGAAFEQTFKDLDSLMVQDLYLKESGFNTWFRRMDSTHTRVRAFLGH
jgi:hypothetical protein